MVLVLDPATTNNVLSMFCIHSYGISVFNSFIYRSCYSAVTGNERRWLVFGIALNKILIPQIRPFVDQEVNEEYNKRKASDRIHKKSATRCLREWQKCLKYENINGNDG